MRLLVIASAALSLVSIGCESRCEQAAQELARRECIEDCAVEHCVERHSYTCPEPRGSIGWERCRKGHEPKCGGDAPSDYDFDICESGATSFDTEACHQQRLSSTLHARRVLQCESG